MISLEIVNLADYKNPSPEHLSPFGQSLYCFQIKRESGRVSVDFIKLSDQMDNVILHDGEFVSN